MLGAVLWPLAVVAVWAALFCLTITFVVNFTRSHDAASDFDVKQTAGDETRPDEARPAAPGAQML